MLTATPTSTTAVAAARTHQRSARTAKKVSQETICTQNSNPATCQRQQQFMQTVKGLYMDSTENLWGNHPAVPVPRSPGTSGALTPLRTAVA